MSTRAVAPAPRDSRAASGSLRTVSDWPTRVPTQIAPEFLTAWSRAEASPPSIGAPSALGLITRLETRIEVTPTPPTVNQDVQGMFQSEHGYIRRQKRGAEPTQMATV